MRSLSELLENKKEDEHRKVFVEVDPDEAFPDDTMSAIKRAIDKGAKDLEKDWDNASVLVDDSLRELKVPKPTIIQSGRWNQYKELIGHSVQKLSKSRGLKAPWRTSDK